MAEIRKAIAVHHTATTDVAWDAGEMVHRVKTNETELKLLHAWKDSGGDPNVKSTYKFPHHMVSGDGQVHAANVKACQAIIGILNGGRGGTDIPDADVEGVYRHAAAHLKDAGVEPPELKRAVAASQVERRAVAEFRIERSANAGGPTTTKLVGTAAPYGVETVIGSGIFAFREVVDLGAFKRALAEGQDVVCWYQHGDGGPLPLGRTKSGTLRLAETDAGLAYECDLPDTQPARDIATSIDRGDLDGMSFAFNPTVPDGAVWDDSEVKDGKLPLRHLRDLDLFDISPVVFPAYPSTSVGTRSAADVYQRFLDSQQGAGSPSEADVAKPEAGLEVERERIELERQR